MTKLNAKIQALVAELFDTKAELFRLQFDEELEAVLGPPATREQLANFEKSAGVSLPASYRAFLEIHNGWSHFSGDMPLLSTEDQNVEWVSEAKDRIRTLFDVGDGPFDSGFVPIMLGEYEDNYLVLDPTRANIGDAAFIAYDYANVERTFDSFDEFLGHELKSAERRLKKAKPRKKT